MRLTHNHKPGWIFLTIALMDLLTGMEFDLAVPSFPALQTHFIVSASWIEALLSINFLGYCISLLFVGGLADRYGRKPIITTGLGIFIVGSILCLLPAMSFSVILIGRFLQGIGIAAPAILSFLIIADTCDLKQQQFLMAMLNGVLNTAAAVAPVIGSYVTLYFHWQGNFTLLLWLGIAVLCMTLFFIPRATTPTQNSDSILRGYGVIFKSTPLMLLISSLFFVFVPYWIFVGISPLLYIKSLHVSLSHFGYYQGVFALVFALGSVGYGLMMKRAAYSQRGMITSAIYIFIASIIAVGGADILNINQAMIITGAMLIFVIGQIIPSAILYPACLNFMPQVKGRVSAMIQGGRLVFAAIGIQIAGIFYQGSFRHTGTIIVIFIAMAVINLVGIRKHLDTSV